MSDQSAAAIAATEVHKHVETFFVTLSVAMRFVRAMRVVWLEEESVRMKREAESLKWKTGSDYMKARGEPRLSTNSIDGEAVEATV